MDPISIVRSICLVAAAIAKAVHQAKSNKNQCSRLSERVETISGFVSNLDPNREIKRELRRALESFLNTLEECQSFVEQFRSQKWHQRAFHVKETKEIFDTLNSQLSTCAGDLNLGINIANTFNSNDDESDVNRDAIEMERMKDEILGQMKKGNEDVKAGMNDLFKARLESMKFNFLKEIKNVVNHNNFPNDDPDFNEIRFYDLEMDSQIGAGGFGEVYKAIWTTCDQVVAVKKLRTSDFSAHVRKQFMDEIRIMRKIQFENVVTLYGVCLEPHNCCLVLEYMDKGSLYDVIHSGEEITWARRWDFALQTARAITYLHSMQPPILHRDVKSLNFLVNSKYVVKVSDFGLSSARLESRTKTKLTTQSGGTIHYAAPERFVGFGTRYDERCDIYSLGVVLWELATRDAPYINYDDDMIRVGVKSGERLPIPENVPEGFKFIIEACWHQDATKRPTGRDLISMIKNQMKKEHINFSKMKIDTSKTDSEPSSVNSINFHTLTPSSISLHGRTASDSRLSDLPTVNFRKNSIDSSEWNNMVESPRSPGNLRPIVENPLEAQAKEYSGIFNLMKLHPQDVPTQESYLSQLTNMCIDEKGPSRFINPSGAAVILTSMRTHSGNVRVQEKALFILWNLVKDSGITIFGNEDLGIIWDDVRRFPHNATIQESGIKIMWNLGLTFRNRRIDEAHLGMILEVTRSYQKDPKIQERAMGVLLCIAAEGNNRTLIIENSGINLVCAGMQTHSSNQIVQEKGCGVLSSLSFERTNRSKLVRIDVVKLILNAMRLHPSSQGIQGRAYGVLINLCFDNVQITNFLTREENLPLIVNPLRTFSTVSSIQEKGCALLWNLSTTNGIPIVKRGGVVVLLEAIGNNQHNPLLLERGYGALWNLSVSSEVRSLILRMSGVKLTLDIVRTSQLYPSVQHRACGFLLNMCEESTARTIISNEKGIIIILECLKYHHSNRGIQSLGGRIFKKLSSNSNSRSIIIGNGGSKYLA